MSVWRRVSLEKCSQTEVLEGSRPQNHVKYDRICYFVPLSATSATRGAPRAARSEGRARQGRPGKAMQRKRRQEKTLKGKTRETRDKRRHDRAR